MLNRRQFSLLATGVGTAGLGMVGYAASRGQGPQTATETNGSSAHDLVLTSRKSKALGADISIDVLHADRGQAELGISAALDEVRTVEQVMSLYQPDSQLCRLNRDGVLRDPHPYLVAVLQEARRMSSASGGAFDVTVQPARQGPGDPAESQC